MHPLGRPQIDHIFIDGTTSAAQRRELADRFQADPGCRVALLSITAAGVGITLTAATVGGCLRVQGVLGGG